MCVCLNVICSFLNIVKHFFFNLSKLKLYLIIKLINQKKNIINQLWWDDNSDKIIIKQSFV